MQLPMLYRQSIWTLEKRSNISWSSYSQFQIAKGGLGEEQGGGEQGVGEQG